MTLFRRLLRATESGALPGPRRWLWKHWYNLMSRRWDDAAWGFMNYGYLPPEPLTLSPAEEPDRPFIGLYHQAVAGLPVAGARVLEVGAGRGGGAAYVARRFAPAELVGVDLSPATAGRAAALHAGLPGLRFQQGDAEALPFPDASFDIVLNIESSHCYGSMDRFVAEVARLLRPGGWFTWVDMRSRAMLPSLEASLAHPAFALRASGSLNAGVVAALDAAEARKGAALGRQRLLRPLLREFAGMQGSLLYRGLRTGEVQYLARRLQRI